MKSRGGQFFATHIGGLLQTQGWEKSADCMKARNIGHSYELRAFHNMQVTSSLSVKKIVGNKTTNELFRCSGELRAQNRIFAKHISSNMVTATSSVVIRTTFRFSVRGMNYF